MTPAASSQAATQQTAAAGTYPKYSFPPFFPPEDTALCCFHMETGLFQLLPIAPKSSWLSPVLLLADAAELCPLNQETHGSRLSSS